MKRSFLGIGLPAFILCSLIGSVLGTGAVTVHYADALSYLSNDPSTCANCHIMRDNYNGWTASSHHAFATCNDCHTPHNLVGKYLVEAENGFHHSRAFTLQDFKDPLIIRPKNSRVLQNACVHCHAELVGDVLGHGNMDDGGAMSCVRCHQSVGHGPIK